MEEKEFELVQDSTGEFLNVVASGDTVFTVPNGTEEGMVAVVFEYYKLGVIAGMMQTFGAVKKFAESKENDLVAMLNAK